MTQAEELSGTNWTPEQNEYLTQNYPLTATKTLAKHLKRTEVAIVVQVKTLGLLRVSEDYTAASLAQLLGCCGNTIVRYVSDGFLRGRQSYKMGRHRRWVFNEEEVVRFLRAYPWLFNTCDMERHYFRSILLEEWSENPWYTTAQAAEKVGCCISTLQVRLRSGEVPAVKRTNYWRIREKDLRRFTYAG